MIAKLQLRYDVVDGEFVLQEFQEKLVQISQG